MTITPDEDLMLFNVGNGKLSFSRIQVTGESQQADVTGANQVYTSVKFFSGPTDNNCPRAAVDYDPTATCPSWNMFLLSVQPDDRLRKFLQVFTAYALLIGGNPEQKLLVHYGSGANGKSVFLETITGLAGGYGCRASADTFLGNRGMQASPDLARMVDSRFVVIEEMPASNTLKESLVKTLTAGTPMLARRLHEAAFEFRPMFKAMLSTSHQPAIEGIDFDVWRRVFMLHWTTTVPAEYRVPFYTLLKMFEGERSGILNWLIDGIKLYLEHGIEAPARPFDLPLVDAHAWAVTSGNEGRTGAMLQAETTEEVHLTRNNVGDFADECLIKTAGAVTQAGALYAAYIGWCELKSLSPVKQISFADAMKRLGFTRIIGRIYSYQDVALKPASRPSAEADAHPISIFDCRAEVLAFALQMEGKLREHDDRPGWKNADGVNLAVSARMKAEDLQVLAWELVGIPFGEYATKSRIASKAASVANFAMMVADVCGALPLPASGETR